MKQLTFFSRNSICIRRILSSRFTFPVKKFIKLMKSEQFVKEPKKNRFAWTLDESKYLDTNQIKALRKVCKKARDVSLKQRKFVHVRDWFMIELGLFSGLRVAEMANLKCGDLHINNKQSSLSVRNGKGNRPRTVRLKKEFKHECLWFLKRGKTIGQDISSGAHLLTAARGTPLTKRALQKAFKRCAKNARLESYYSVHCLRHTYGSHLYKASKYNLRLVQEQLGHSSIKTTQIYVNLINDDVEQALENLYGK